MESIPNTERSWLPPLPIMNLEINLNTPIETAADATTTLEASPSTTRESSIFEEYPTSPLPDTFFSPSPIPSLPPRPLARQGHYDDDDSSETSCGPFVSAQSWNDGSSLTMGPLGYPYDDLLEQSQLETLVELAQQWLITGGHGDGDDGVSFELHAEVITGAGELDVPQEGIEHHGSTVVEDDSIPLALTSDKVEAYQTSTPVTKNETNLCEEEFLARIEFSEFSLEQLATQIPNIQEEPNSSEVSDEEGESDLPLTLASLINEKVRLNQYLAGPGLNENNIGNERSIFTEVDSAYQLLERIYLNPAYRSSAFGFEVFSPATHQLWQPRDSTPESTPLESHESGQVSCTVTPGIVSSYPYSGPTPSDEDETNFVEPAIPDYTQEGKQPFEHYLSPAAPPVVPSYLHLEPSSFDKQYNYYVDQPVQGPIEEEYQPIHQHLNATAPPFVPSFPDHVPFPLQDNNFVQPSTHDPTQGEDQPIDQSFDPPIHPRIQQSARADRLNPYSPACTHLLFQIRTFLSLPPDSSLPQLLYAKNQLLHTWFKKDSWAGWPRWFQRPFVASKEVKELRKRKKVPDETDVRVFGSELLNEEKKVFWVVINAVDWELVEDEDERGNGEMQREAEVVVGKEKHILKYTPHKYFAMGYPTVRVKEVEKGLKYQAKKPSCLRSEAVVERVMKLWGEGDEEEQKVLHSEVDIVKDRDIEEDEHIVRDQDIVADDDDDDIEKDETVINHQVPVPMDWDVQDWGDIQDDEEEIWDLPSEQLGEELYDNEDEGASEHYSQGDSWVADESSHVSDDDWSPDDESSVEDESSIIDFARAWKTAQTIASHPTDNQWEA